MKKIFILGNPRSGTTLFRLMLNAHSSISAPPECGFLHWWYKKYKNWDDACNNENDIAKFIEDLKTSKKIETWNLDFSQLKLFIEQVRPSSYSLLGELIYEFQAKSSGKGIKLIADKNNYYISHLNDLVSIWPDAFFIQLIRDGRDVACSYKDIKKLETTSVYKPELSYQITDIANEWNTNNQNIYSFISKNKKGIVVRYEDLILKTDRELKKICLFLGLPFDKFMLNYFKPEFHNEPIVTMDWKKKTLLPPDEKNVGRYKTVLEKKEINIFNQIAKKSLLQFKYNLI